ncbi:DUF1800 domain-containing protein [Stagnihabitans tardus]|uniref:DUF1800 family protein n=1 Tax=Stagnihabitans tardus TaxID=2699202 RepID=A0AAE4YA57_9RHOB|nr:DUF1800 domain-containing protein [Stagnihabitans tardus]NBZ88149.1 DUF1800 family protein [Stagnihabitans tardus]
MEAPSLLEDIRFGYGPLAGRTPGQGGIDPDRVLAQLAAPDASAATWDRPPLAKRWNLIEIYAQDRKAGLLRQGAKEADPRSRKLIQIEEEDAQSFISRPAVAQCGFRERLVNFWANRITVAASGQILRHLIQSYRDEAIRPHVTGRLTEMLKATLWHPAMQTYLTQTQSVGPNSKLGKRQGKGLNENLAREFLELHTMGSGYSQEDVTELARLLAGMKNDAEGPRVEDNRAEPGRKTILGTSYDPGRDEIDRLVETVARRPETARATAFFMARHFIADAPPEDLVATMAQAYLDHDTDLTALYRAMLTHKSARSRERQKLRTPHELVVASLRLTGLTGLETGLRGFRKEGMKLIDRLKIMGQPVYLPARPDGWPEVSEAWLTPPMVSARVDWSIDLGRAVGERADPVAMADFALGDLASPILRRAVAGAEQRWEGVTVLLSSPDFSRR